MLANPQNLRPVFSQEQLATSLHATCLQDVASDAAALVNLLIPFVDTAALVEDIKEGLLVDPIAKRELDLCVKIRAYMSLITDLNEETFIHVYSRRNMTIPQPVT